MDELLAMMPLRISRVTSSNAAFTSACNCRISSARTACHKVSVLEIASTTINARTRAPRSSGEARVACEQSSAAPVSIMVEAIINAIEFIGAVNGEVKTTNCTGEPSSMQTPTAHATGTLNCTVRGMASATIANAHSDIVVAAATAAAPGNQNC